MSKKHPHDPRRLLVLFTITTLVPAAGLSWLGWRMVEQDRALEGQRLQERRDQAADLAAAALQRILAEAEERLSTYSAARISPASDVSDGAVLVTFGGDGVLDHAGTALPFYPALPAAPEAKSLRLAEADELELGKNDLRGALHKLEETAKDVALKGEALLRMARIHKKLGALPNALAAFSELGKLDFTRVSGLPAGLRAAQGRAMILEAMGRSDDLRREAARLCDSLENGRWLLTRAEFSFSYEQARGWLGKQPREEGAPERLALAGAVESLWQEWRARENQPDHSRGRRTLRSGDESVLALTRSTTGRFTALLIGPQFLDSAWRKVLRSAGAGQDTDFALTDAEGRPVLGHPDVPLLLQSVRTASATHLPWTVHAIGRGRGFGQPELSGRTRLTLAGIVMMAAIMLAGGYFINSAVVREVTVARLQSDFVAAVSHEFRTPLTTLRQLSEMLVHGRVSTAGRREEFYKTLHAESERLHRLVEGLLDFGRMEAGQLQYRFEPVDPEAFMRGVVSDFQREVSGIGYSVELHGGGSLPAIRGDRESLARVFWNLLDNAVKYSPESKTIWVDVSEAGQRLMVRVRDRGLGIPAAEQKEIFQKFVRGAAAKQSSIRGTGVGLAMASQIVAAHGGDISVDSKPGEGSVFTVLLPAFGAEA